MVNRPRFNVKLLSWNVNGIRAASRSGFLDWFSQQQADIVCVQETKAHPDQLSPEILHPLNYHSYWHSAQKAGYSGVATFSKVEPLRVQMGLGISEIDAEGRVLLTEFPHFVLLNTYFPNSQRDHARLGFKLSFCAAILQFCEKWRSQGKNVVICGDFNIAHQEIDLRNPKSNRDNAGFLPEERAWLDQFIQTGYVDSFREFVKDPGHYTWWSYRPGVRAKNIGWRIDYFMANQEFKDRFQGVAHQPEVRGSDHCPVHLELRS